MEKIETVLVPLDGSDLAKQALPYAVSLAGNSGRLALLTVVSLPTPLTERGFVDLDGPADGPAMQAAQQALRETADDLSRHLAPEVEVELLVSQGDPAEEILLAAQAHDADLIALTSHARGAIGRAAFGSIADRVVRTADIPVVVIRPRDQPTTGYSETFHRLVVPHDGSGLAAGALPVAKATARRLGIPVWIVRALDLKPSFFGEGSLPMPEAIAEDRRAKALAELETMARELENEGIDASAEVLVGAPFSAIAAAVDPDDLIVMTSHGRSGFNRWLLGSVADKLIRSGPTPVCLVPTRRAVADERDS